MPKRDWEKEERTLDDLNVRFLNINKSLDGKCKLCKKNLDTKKMEKHLPNCIQNVLGDTGSKYIT